MTNKVEKIIRKLTGTVISDKMDKTVVVQVERVKKHPKYLKYYKTHKTYKVHDPKNEIKVGQTVTFVPCRPLSKDKRWRISYSTAAKVTKEN